MNDVLVAVGTGFSTLISVVGVMTTLAVDLPRAMNTACMSFCYALVTVAA